MTLDIIFHLYNFYLFIFTKTINNLCYSQKKAICIPLFYLLPKQPTFFLTAENLEMVFDLLQSGDPIFTYNVLRSFYSLLTNTNNFYQKNWLSILLTKEFKLALLELDKNIEMLKNQDLKYLIIFFLDLFE